MKPIWWFVGLLLTVVGAVITVAGVVDYFFPPEHQPLLAHLHPAIWWGAFIFVSGLVYLGFNRNRTVD
jgi:hypothetical protein